jgi:transcriptional regulator with XRE-family HTH domain
MWQVGDEMIEIEEHCAQLLRSLRKKKGLTLRECEIQSEGMFKAVVMGSYERGTRAISLQRLQELADFYHVPIEYFFQSNEQSAEGQPLRYRFDLRKLRQNCINDAGLTKMSNFLSHMIKKRNDWNGEILTIRNSDGDYLPLLADDGEIISKLDLYGVLIRVQN